MASVMVNPWFVFTRNALSDLGGPHARLPWIYNCGLVATAVLVIAYAAYVIDRADNKLIVTSAAFMAVGGIFLAMIGVFHEGTYPHVFVSTWFFVQMDLSLILWGAGSLAEGLRLKGSAEVALGVAAPAVAIMVRWPSTAVEEVYGIVIIDVFVLLSTYDVLTPGRFTRRRTR